jgi:NAD(P)-dependent dehydrogenase (short-subunit alcohol dehydrogenase family)
MNINYNFSGKVAVVTGAAGGLGKAVAMQFCKFGAKVIICDVKEEMAEETLEEIKQAGGTAIFCYTDITSEESVAAMKKTVLDTYGTIDILINNAGIGPSPYKNGPPMTNIPIEEWQKLIQVNILGMIRVTYAFYDVFKEKREGKIVCTASIAGYLPSPLQPHYSLTKIGVMSFAQSLSQDLGPYNINVNVVNPGFIYTPIYHRALEWKEMRPQQFEKCETPQDVMMQMARNMSAMQRAQEPEDIANAVMFLCSDGAKEMTGQNINVDSGIIRRQ